MNKRFIKAALMITGMVPGLCAAQLPGVPVIGFAAGGTGLTPFYVLGFELGPWQNYLARELTPSYMIDPDLPPLHISWLDPEFVAVLPAFAAKLIEQPSTWGRFEMDLQYMDTRNIQGIDQTQMSPGRGFERQMLTSGIFHELDHNSIIGVEAILAYQSYGTSRLGMVAHSQPLSGFREFGRYSPYQESGYGTGVRLNVSSEVLPGMTLGARFQSRIDMEEFAYYRGVYSSPADFDIPARASLGMVFNTHGHSSLNVSIERVMYSEVSAFPSRMLPDRFLSMLGDSTSPNFAWDDLTVYTIGYTWSNGKNTRLKFDVSTRSTPSTTSGSLQRAIESDLADHAMVVGYSRLMSDDSRFNLNAAYAPADFIFGGNVLGVASENLGQDFELEANWTWDF